MNTVYEEQVDARKIISKLTYCEDAAEVLQHLDDHQNQDPKTAFSLLCFSNPWYLCHVQSFWEC